MFRFSQQSYIAPPPFPIAWDFKRSPAPDKKIYTCITWNKGAPEPPVCISCICSSEGPVYSYCTWHDVHPLPRPSCSAQRLTQVHECSDIRILQMSKALPRGDTYGVAFNHGQTRKPVSLLPIRASIHVTQPLRIQAPRSQGTPKVILARSILHRGHPLRNPVKTPS